MKRTLIALAALAVLALGIPGAALAQEKRFELTPMIGYRTIANISETELSGYKELKFSDEPTYGIGFGYRMNRSFDGEISYSYTQTDATAVPRDSHLQERTFSLNVHDIQFTGLFMFKSPQDAFRPYLGLGLGWSILDAGDVGSTSRFTFALSGGAKFYFNDKVGLRLEARWIPVYLYSTTDGVWCDPFYGCYYYGDDTLMSQADFRIGLIIRF